MLEASKPPYKNYAWEHVLGACCEDVIGFMPVGVAAASRHRRQELFHSTPMATTEGVLVQCKPWQSSLVYLHNLTENILYRSSRTKGEEMFRQRIETIY